MSGHILFLGNKIFEIPPFFQTRSGDLGKKVDACSLRFSALKAKPRCVLPAFLCAYIFIKRETSGYEAATALVGKSNGKDTITTHFDRKKQKRILLVDR